MEIRAGYEIVFSVQQRTPMILMLSVHPSRRGNLVTEDDLVLSPAIPRRQYCDIFGNICTRIVVPPGSLKLSTSFVIRDSGRPDETVLNAREHAVEELPDDVLVYLLGSRYCDTQRLSDVAWRSFGGVTAGWARVQAICDFVHDNIKFGYAHARDDRTAFDAFHEKVGVCRDFAHLSITLCRCMNIPARYCTGYLGDIGVPRDPAPMDFSAWFEVFLDGKWLTFDARHNCPRIGRILVARGRDAADVAISTSFGAAPLTNFKVVTEEIQESSPVHASHLKVA
jgi:transglutaminase-like putative cysteine protease